MNTLTRLSALYVVALVVGIAFGAVGDGNGTTLAHVNKPAQVDGPLYVLDSDLPYLPADVQYDTVITVSDIPAVFPANGQPEIRSLILSEHFIDSGSANLLSTALLLVLEHRHVLFGVHTSSQELITGLGLLDQPASWDPQQRYIPYSDRDEDERGFFHAGAGYRYRDDDTGWYVLNVVAPRPREDGTPTPTPEPTGQPSEVGARAVPANAIPYDLIDNALDDFTAAQQTGELGGECAAQGTRQLGATQWTVLYKRHMVINTNTGQWTGKYACCPSGRVLIVEKAYVRTPDCNDQTLGGPERHWYVCETVYTWGTATGGGAHPLSERGRLDCLVLNGGVRGYKEPWVTPSDHYYDCSVSEPYSILSLYDVTHRVDNYYEPASGVPGWPHSRLDAYKPDSFVRGEQDLYWEINVPTGVTFGGHMLLRSMHELTATDMRDFNYSEVKWHLVDKLTEITVPGEPCRAGKNWGVLTPGPQTSGAMPNRYAFGSHWLTRTPTIALDTWYNFKGVDLWNYNSLLFYWSDKDFNACAGILPVNHDCTGPYGSSDCDGAFGLPNLVLRDNRSVPPCGGGIIVPPQPTKSTSHILLPILSVDWQLRPEWNVLPL